MAATALLAGLAIVTLSQLEAGGRGGAAPLFDGVVVEDPYRYVEPQPGEARDPFAASAVEPVTDGSVPLLAIATAEVPPQAQLIAQADAFEIGAGTTSIAISIQPVAPDDPQVAGNVYRFTASDQTGAALAVASGAQVTIVLRGSQPDPGAVIARRDGTQWLALPTEHGGLPDLYYANVDRLGEYAVLAAGAAPSGPGPSSAASGETPSPSSDGGGGDAGAPIWVILALVIAALGIGVAVERWGGAERV
jgi:hypothetical protein